MNNNEDLRNIANKIITKAGLNDNEKFGSVVIILMVISVILTAIRILQECNKQRTMGMAFNDKCDAYGKAIKEFSIKRGWFTRMRLKKLLKKELGIEDYQKYGLKLLEAILDVGENLTDDEVKTLVENAYV